MLAQYLVSLGATNLRKSKKVAPMLSILLRLTRKGPFMSILLMESFCIAFQNYLLRLDFSLSLVLNLLSIFHQISDSCCHKIVFIKRITRRPECIKEYRKLNNDCCCRQKFFQPRKRALKPAIVEYLLN